MTHAGDSEGPLTLGSAVILRRLLPGAEIANRELFRVVLDLERRRGADATAHIDPLAADNPAVRWLRDGIARLAGEWPATAGHTATGSPQLSARAEVDRFGDWRGPRHTPDADLAGVYFVQIPRVGPKPAAGQVSVAASLILFNPGHDPAAGSATRDLGLEPPAGLVLLWPGFLYHFLAPNLSRELRVSIAISMTLPATAALPR